MYPTNKWERKKRRLGFYTSASFISESVNMERLTFVLVDADYCDYLRKSDPCVPYTMDKKSNRPFVGILLKIHGMSYYAPLSSPKAKHLNMKNQIDLLKINGGVYGVINFNNMIPIHSNSIRPIVLTVSSTDTLSDIQYKGLLSNQLTWCNANKNIIVAKAQKLYETIKSNHAREALAARCCHFSKDEEQLKQYFEAKGWLL